MVSQATIDREALAQRLLEQAGLPEHSCHISHHWKDITVTFREYPAEDASSIHVDPTNRDGSPFSRHRELPRDQVHRETETGFMEFFTTHLVIYRGEQVLMSIDIDEIDTLQREREVHFGPSFAAVGTLRTTVFLATDSGAKLALILHGRTGERVARGVELLWKTRHNQLTDHEASMFRAVALPDALYCLSAFPIETDATVSYNSTSQSLVGREVVLRVHRDGTIALVFRPQDPGAVVVSATKKPNFELPPAWQFTLDSVILVHTTSDELRITRDDSTSIVLHQVTNPEVIQLFQTVWVCNTCSVIVRGLRKKMKMPPFTLDDLNRLLNHFEAIDVNGDGRLTLNEFSHSLGPIITASETLTHTMFSIFNVLQSTSVTFYEFVHGARVLLRGDEDDRLEVVFRLFDSTREGQVNKAQFLKGLELIAECTSLRPPEKETMERFSNRLFEAIDIDKSDFVDLDEFTTAMKSNPTVTVALKELTNQRHLLKQKASAHMANVVMFGDEGWLRITQILTGVSFCCKIPETKSEGGNALEQAAQAAGAAISSLSNAMFNDKICYNLVTGDKVGFSGQKKSPGTIFFNDYAPQAFEKLRAAYGINPAAYLASLGVSQLRSSLLFGIMTPIFQLECDTRATKFTFISHDNRFIVKSISTAEATVLRQILPDYVAHMEKNPNSLLSRYCGLHAVITNGIKVQFVVMANVVNNDLPISRAYRLRGSPTVNKVHEKGVVKTGGVPPPLDDAAFGNRVLKVEKSVRDALVLQLAADSNLLAKYNINNYDFLLAIHESQFGEAITVDESTSSSAVRRHKFQSYGGGIVNLRSTEVYYCGVVDMLRQYAASRKAKFDSSQKSSEIPPQDYQERFVKYLGSILEGVHSGNGK